MVLPSLEIAQTHLCVKKMRIGIRLVLNPLADNANEGKRGPPPKMGLNISLVIFKDMNVLDS